MQVDTKIRLAIGFSVALIISWGTAAYLEQRKNKEACERRGRVYECYNDYVSLDGGSGVVQSCRCEVK